MDLTVGHDMEKTQTLTSPVCDLGDVLFRVIVQAYARREDVGTDVSIYT